MKLSASQLKCYKNDKATWGWRYLLWFRDSAPKTYFDLGTAFHKFMQTGEKEEAVRFIKDTGWHESEKKNMLKTLETLFSNAEWYEEEWVGPPEREKYVEWEIRGVTFCWYVDCVYNDKCIDYKTAATKTTPENKPRMWSTMTPYEEYALQAYIYMKLTGTESCDFVEVYKKVVKKYDVQHNMITFNLTLAFEKKMEDMHKGDVLELIKTYNEYKWI